MSEEEKKAIELINLLYTDNLTQFGKRQLADLIEKQQKEIENLKEINEEHQKLNGELRDVIENLQNDNMEKDLIIYGLREERRLAAEEIQEQYFVSKDKIREKIEEYDKIRLETKDSDLYDEMQDYIDVLIKLLKEE